MINKSIQIKEEGKAGLFFAYDKNGKYISAELAIKGEEYACPICRCKMHLTTTRSGKKIYARNPGQIHRSPICITIEKKGVEKAFINTNPKDFITSLCYITARQNYRITENLPNEVENNNLPIKYKSSDDVKLSSFTSLKQIAESGISFLNPYDKQGDYCVSDYILAYKYASDFFLNPNFQLDARIIYAKFDWIQIKSKSFIFSMYEKERFSVRFILQTNRTVDFLYIKDMIGEYVEDELGKTVFKKYQKYQTFLIASDDWTKMDKMECKSICGKNSYCQNCVGMYKATYVSKNQIYSIPSKYNH